MLIVLVAVDVAGRYFSRIERFVWEMPGRAAICAYPAVVGVSIADAGGLASPVGLYSNDPK